MCECPPANHPTSVQHTRSLSACHLSEAAGLAILGHVSKQDQMLAWAMLLYVAESGL